MLSFQFNRSTIAAIALLALPVTAVAQTPDHPADNSAQFPSTHDLKMLTTSGSYLAARHASVERDAASAATFYRSALRTDPKNNELLDRAFISSLADGDIDEAVKLADRILAVDKTNRVARLWIGGARSNRKNIRAPRPTSTSRSAGRSPTSLRRCCPAGRHTAPAMPRGRSPRSTSLPV